MAKVVPRKKKRAPRRETNWLLLGGIIAIGVVGLFALLFVTLQNQGVPTPTPELQFALESYCEANESNCVEKGNPEAPVTVVEVSDYGCGFCRDFNSGPAQALDEQYVQSDQVQWVIVPYALGQATLPAAEAAMCAAEQEQFFPFHERMFAIQRTELALVRAGFVQEAQALDMDMDDFEDCLDSGRYNDEVQRNIAVLSAAGVTATPTFLVNGKKIEGNLSEEIRRAIDAILGS